MLNASNPQAIIFNKQSSLLSRGSVSDSKLSNCSIHVRNESKPSANMLKFKPYAKKILSVSQSGDFHCDFSDYEKEKKLKKIDLPKFNFDTNPLIMYRNRHRSYDCKSFFKIG